MNLVSEGREQGALTQIDTCKDNNLVSKLKLTNDRIKSQKDCVSSFVKTLERINVSTYLDDLYFSLMACCGLSSADLQDLWRSMMHSLRLSHV